jgi:preprotein translocase subunit YajC
MKLISDLMQSIEGIEIWYIISLLIFFVMFLLFIIRILKKPRSEMEKIKNSILNDHVESESK